MNKRVVLTLCTLAAFGALTGYAIHVVGYFGILAAGMDGWCFGVSAQTVRKDGPQRMGAAKQAVPEEGGGCSLSAAL